jgi:hypothetical protein
MLGRDPHGIIGGIVAYGQRLETESKVPRFRFSDLDGDEV